MAKFAGISILLLAGCVFYVDAIRIDLPKVLPVQKYSLPRDVPNITPNDPRCEKNGLFVHPTDCTKYYVCNDGHSQDRSCPNGFKFDTYKHCTLDKDANCGKITQDGLLSKIKGIVCPEDYGIFVYPSDCHKYIVCSLGKPEIKYCPKNQIYQRQVGCVNGDVCPPPKPESESVCKKQNALYSISGDCHKYIKCVNGVPEEKECPQGQGFDLKRMQCTRLRDARCRSNEIHEVMEN